MENSQLSLFVRITKFFVFTVSFSFTSHKILRRQAIGEDGCTEAANFMNLGSSPFCHTPTSFRARKMFLRSRSLTSAAAFALSAAVEAQRASNRVTLERQSSSALSSSKKRSASTSKRLRASARASERSRPFLGSEKLKAASFLDSFFA